MYFQMVINVYNGLTTAVFRQMIVVTYAKATPIFNASKYVSDITENTPTGSIVFTFKATSADLVEEIRYSVIGKVFLLPYIRLIFSERQNADSFHACNVVEC